MTVEKIHVNVGGGYDVVVGEDILSNAGDLIKNVLSPNKIAVVTDSNVDKLYADVVIKSLNGAGFKVVKFVFPAGEQSKNLTTYGQIIEFLAQNELTRTDAIVALGGGVVGDMAGFSAATYLRGIKYVQIPTTLLAQIDSSVGGKTAVDLPQGKNLVGAFCQPALVICDVGAIKDLPNDVYVDGMGELAKYGLLDKDIYAELIKTDRNINTLVKMSIDYKRKVVEVDEFEKNERKFLNLGHTPCHGIEKASNYTITHGKAVGMGLKIMTASALKKGYIDKATYDDIMVMLDATVGAENCPFDAKTLANNALKDKKRDGDKITVVTIHGIGDCRLEKINVDLLEDLFTV